VTLFDQEAIEAAAMAICMQDGHWPEQDLGLGKLRWTLYKKHAEVALATAEASLRARNCIIAYMPSPFTFDRENGPVTLYFPVAIIRIAGEDTA
jgi:hypothetical protein